MVLLLVTMGIAAALMRAAIADIRQIVIDRWAMQADRLAEAGLARAAAMLGENDSYGGETWTPELPSEESATVAIAVERTEGRLTVTAVATYPSNGDRPVRARRSYTRAQSNR